MVVNWPTSYEYVRRVKNSNSPVTDVKSASIVCNVGGNDADSRAATKTYTVKPGDQIGFDVNSDLGHPGPLAVYMSRAPDGVAASNYLGDGDWFKVYELTTSRITTSTGLEWATFPNSVGAQNFTFTLPSNLRPGNYLVRPEHIGLHGAGSAGGAQFYLGCAQIQVTGSGTGVPSPTVKFPGAYSGNEPGILSMCFPNSAHYVAKQTKTNMMIQSTSTGLPHRATPPSAPSLGPMLARITLSISGAAPAMETAPRALNWGKRRQRVQ